MVVYAGRSFSGKASWISRIEHRPRFHSASIICSSSLDNFGNAIVSPIEQVDPTMRVCIDARQFQNAAAQRNLYYRGSHAKELDADWINAAARPGVVDSVSL